MQVNAWDITSKKCIWTHIFSPFFYTDTELVKLSISLSYLWIGCPIVQDLCILGFGENLMWHFPCILKGLFCFCFFSFESTNEALLPCVQNSKRKKFLLLEYKVDDHANASFSWCCVINWVYQLKRIWGKNQPILIEKGP